MFPQSRARVALLPMAGVGRVMALAMETLSRKAEISKAASRVTRELLLADSVNEDSMVLALLGPFFAATKGRMAPTIAERPPTAAAVPANLPFGSRDSSATGVSFGLTQVELPDTVSLVSMDLVVVVDEPFFGKRNGRTAPAMALIAPTPAAVPANLPGSLVVRETGVSFGLKEVVELVVLVVSDPSTLAVWKRYGAAMPANPAMALTTPAAAVFWPFLGVLVEIDTGVGSGLKVVVVLVELEASEPSTLAV